LPELFLVVPRRNFGGWVLHGSPWAVEGQKNKAFVNACKHLIYKYIT